MRSPRIAFFFFFVLQAFPAWGKTVPTSPLAQPDTVLIDTDSSFDVTYVKFDLALRPDTEYIAGSVLLRSMAHGLRSDNTIQLSLRGQLQVDSVFNDGLPISYQHSGDKLFLTLGQHYADGTLFDVTVYYHGYSTIPDRGGFIHTWQECVCIQPDTNDYWQRKVIPICWSSSEPFGAKDWWPCKDNPADKIDSADLIFTCKQPYSVASNGTLVSMQEHDSSRTYSWHESYPVDHYLLAFLCTQFDTIDYWHHWADGDSMRITDFVFPGSIDTLRPQLKEVDTILNLYESWFGPYAFRREKYGTAQWHGGGMENETLSFCNNADPELVAHETAHQWFGDAITCKVWNDCWLNEGFATYTTDLYSTSKFGPAFFASRILDHETYVTSRPGGSVHTPDSLLVNHTLDGRLVYAKGALVLNMLRYVLGSDSAYFRALREYITGPLRYGVATTEDLRASIERSSGMDLKWFFDEWVYDEGYPIYTVAWNWDSLHPAVAISQMSSVPWGPVFKMPIQLRFQGNGIDTTVQVWNDQPLTPYSFSFSKPVTQVTFDPNNWILDGSAPRTLGVESPGAANGMVLSVNPVGEEYAIDFSLPRAANVSIGMYDLLGRLVATLAPGWQDAGRHTLSWQPGSLPNGTYFCKLDAGSGQTSLVHFQRVQ